MSLLQPPDLDHPQRFQIFALIFDHNTGTVSIDCVDPSEVIAGGAALNRRYDVPQHLSDEVQDKVSEILANANDIACAADERM